jgi:tetratricopeptide (TPR) repeat protein
MDFDSLYTQICFDLKKIDDGRGTSTRFSSCSSDSQRISFVLGLESVRACLHEPLDLAKQKSFLPCKSNDQSISYRVEGDGYYQKKLNWKAICSYNHSLLVGEGEALALAYANRSAVFFDTADWLHALRDIQLALDQGYPKHLEHRLRERQGDCWLELGHVNEALISFNIARDLLTVSQTTQQQKDKLSHLVLKLKQTKNKQKKGKKCESSNKELISSVKSIEQEVIKKRRSAPELYRARNILLPSASTSVKLKITADRGRCLVATEDIEIGNISLPACFLTYTNRESS